MRSGFGVHTMHRFVLPKLRLVFSQRTCPIHFFRLKTKFSGWFRVILLPGGTVCEIGLWGAYNAPLYASEVASFFFATNMPNPLLLAQNNVSGWFRAIPLPGGTSCEIGFWGS